MKELILPFKVSTTYLNSVSIWKYSNLNEDLVVDFSYVKNAGMNLFIILRSINNDISTRGYQVILENVPGFLANYEKFFYEELKIQKKVGFTKYFKNIKSYEKFFYMIGDNTIIFLQGLYDSFFLALYMLYKSFLAIFYRENVNKGETIRQMEILGYDAIRIVVLINVLISLVMSLQGVLQLDKFGAGIFAAPTIGLTMINELGPVMTAIIIIGRSGSAVTAEVATMNVNEELDGLTVMGISPIDYIIIPKIWAFSIMGPVLGVLGTFMGILAGTIISILYLKIDLSLFLNEMFVSIGMFDLFISMSKNFAFSIMIVLVAVVQGVKVSGGAEEVGKSTTKSVVYALVGVTLLNSLFSVVYL